MPIPVIFPPPFPSSPGTVQARITAMVGLPVTGSAGEKCQRIRTALRWIGISKSESPRRKAEPTDLDIARVLTEFVPLSKTMAEQITALRTWAKGRARFATSPAEERKLRKLAA